MRAGRVLTRDQEIVDHLAAEDREARAAPVAPGRTWLLRKLICRRTVALPSRAHGPNEFLRLPTARKLTCCVAETIRRHALR